MESFRQNVKWHLLGVLFLANLFVWNAIFAESRNGVLTVAFLDVGQGDAIFIEAPNGNQLLIDGGPDRSVLRELSSVMPFYDRSIDVVVATHPDKDHVHGLIDVMKRFDVRYFFEPGTESDTSSYRALKEEVEKSSTEKILARRGMRVHLDEDAFLEILFPDRDVSGVETNTASIVAQLHYGGTTFLLAGDSPQSIENYVVSLEGGNLKSDVLKLGHHGSKTSTSEVFLGFVSPRYAIISSGKNNSYGHPHQDVMDTLARFGVDSMRTDALGTVVFRSDGERLYHSY